MEIKGNITLLTQGNSEIQNAVMERKSTAPAVQESEKGRIYFNTVSNTYFYNDGAAWVQIASGGDAQALQDEVDAIETSLGGAISSTGTFVAGGLTGYAADATSLTDAIQKVADAVTGHDQLAELDDVSVGGATTGQSLVFDGVSWVNHSLVLVDVTDITSTASEVNQLHSAGATNADFIKLHDITSTAAELNILDGATLSVAELNYVDGVTSGIQDQLDNKQPLDAQLTSIAGLSPTVDEVIFGATTAGEFELDSGAGARGRLGLVIGTDVLAYDLDVKNFGDLAPTDGQFLVGTGGIEGARWTLESTSVARDSLGLGTVATHGDDEYVRVDGTHTMTADLPMGGFQVTGLGTTTNATDAATKSYVDGYITGISWQDPVDYVNLVDDSLSAPPVAPVISDAYLVADTATGAWAGKEGHILQWDGSVWLDGGLVTTGLRLGVSFETATAGAGGFASMDNKILTVTTATPGSYAYSAYTPDNNDATFVANPTAYHFGHSYVYKTTSTSWINFGAPALVGAGSGLSYSGNTLGVNMGAGIVALPSDEVGIDLFDTSGSALVLTVDGTARSELTGAKLHLLLKTTGNGLLVQDSSGLKVTTNTITEAELTASVAGDGLVGGNGTALAVASHAGTSSTIGTLTITADSVGVDLGTTSTTAAPGDHIHAASVVTFDNSVTLLAGAPSNAQDAIVALDSRADTMDGTVSDLQDEVDAIETAAGLGTDGTLAAFTLANYISLDATLRAAIVTLDGQAQTEETARLAVNTKVNAGYFKYVGGTASTTHTVTHGIDCKYCNVTVVDSTDNVIIPQAIVFDSANALTVTFNASIACKVVVTGLNGFGV